MTGSYCQGKNCAAASAADAIFFGSRGGAELTADQVRKKSGMSCVPGVNSPSGGLTIAAVEDVAAEYGVDVDYGRAANSFYRRWLESEGRSRLGTYYGGIILGNYSRIPDPWRAKGSTFRGGHSAFCHDYREDMPDSHFGVIQPTVSWHDPLRPRPIRIPWDVVVGYWQQPGSDLRGFAGWVKIPPPAGAVYASPMTDRTRVRYKTAAVHSSRTTGAASTTRIIKPHGKLVEIAMYAKSESYKGSTE